MTLSDKSFNHSINQSINRSVVVSFCAFLM
jgi:hypothetical protein